MLSKWHKRCRVLDCLALCLAVHFIVLSKLSQFFMLGERSEQEEGDRHTILP